jgi:hypothetical protein
MLRYLQARRNPAGSPLPSSWSPHHGCAKLFRSCAAQLIGKAIAWRSPDWLWRTASTCRPRRWTSRGWGTGEWDCSSTSMRSAANSGRIFRMNGTRHILTGRLRVAPPTFAGADFRCAWFRRPCQWLAPCQQLHVSRQPGRAGPRNRVAVGWINRAHLARSHSRSAHARRRTLQPEDWAPATLHQAKKQPVHLKRRSCATRDFGPSGSGRIFAETFRHRLISSVNSLLFSVQTQLISPGKSASKGRWIPTPATSAATCDRGRLANVFQTRHRQL